jgi:hypothetical protein
MLDADRVSRPSYMFGQFAWLPEPPDVPPEPPEGCDDVPGEVDGDGLAALTTATPPIASKPAESRSEAIARRAPLICEPVDAAGAASGDVCGVAAIGGGVYELKEAFESMSVPRVLEMD